MKSELGLFDKGEPFLIDREVMVTAFSHDEWLHFKNRTILVTGASGFLGKWILFALLDAETRFGLGMRVICVTRDIQNLDTKVPPILLSAPFYWIESDIRQLCSAYSAPPPSIIIHGATDIANSADADPVETFSVCVDGTRNILELAKKFDVERVLFLSSGAVYGSHANSESGYSEIANFAPDTRNIQSAYGQGKRASEWLLYSLSHTNNVKVSIARIYGQVGPYLPLDKHFAMGNFLLAALEKEDLFISGDGTPLRSYCYVTDTVRSLFFMLLRHEISGVFNVGGEQRLTILELAKLVKQLCAPEVSIIVSDKKSVNVSRDHYYPDLTRFNSQICRWRPVELSEAITNTFSWLQENK